MDLPSRLPMTLHPITQGYHNKIWDYRPPAGHTIEHLLHPDYFVHALSSTMMRPNDEIRCIAEDRSYYVQLFVADVDPAKQWAKMILLHAYWTDAADAVEADPGKPDRDGYKVEFSGPHKWRVLSPAGTVVAKGYATKKEAETALAGLKTTRAA